MKKLSILLLSIVIVGSVFAQNANKSMTNVFGTIHNDTTWTNDTVNVIGDLYVPDSVTLTINAGTVVLFDNQYCIDIQGCIIAQGALNDSITFTATDTSGFHDTTHVGWSGLRFDSLSVSVDTSIISFCKFLYFYNDSTDTSAIYINDFSKIIIENSRFSHNIHTGIGWPAYSQTACCIQIENETSMHILNNIFTYNYGAFGCVNLGCSESGDIIDVLIKGNIFRYNIGGDECSSLKLSGYTQAMVINNIFEYNYSENRGGAICISGYCLPTLIGNLIANNYAVGNGGAFTVKYYANPKIINNTIVQNYSEDNGGAISVGCYTTSLLIQNNIIWGNEAEGDGEQLYIYDDYDYTPGYNISSNIIQGGFDSIYVYNSYAGIFNNNLDTSPAFLDSINHDYNLTCSSPAIDAASFPYSVMPLLDVDGNPRLMGSVYDIGAYEKNVYATVVSNPQSVVVMTGTSTSFNVTAIGATSYQWQLSDNLGSSWTNITNNAVYSGSTTATLNINADYSLNGNQYRCELGGVCPGALSYTDYAFLIVDFNVEIDENENMISVYPNPSKGDFVVQNAKGANLIISDVNGRVVDSYSNLSSDKEIINLSNQARGIYFLKIIKEDNLEVIKLIKE
jgi:predicted outer membrane repeat protein